VKRKPPKVQPGKPTRTPQKGDLICGECGEANVPGRKFCSRCGTSLAAAVVVKIPWWKRMFRRKPKSAMAGERPWDDKSGGARRSRSAKARAASSPRSDACCRSSGRARHPLRRVRAIPELGERQLQRGQGQGAVDHPSEFDQVTVGPGTTSNDVTPNPDHPGVDGVDGFKNTYWLTAPPSDAFRPELDVQLTEKVDLER
jgi:hypothetical protein